MTVLNSKLCWGTLVHRRYRPKTHELRYRVFSLLVDLDETALGRDADRLDSGEPRFESQCADLPEPAIDVGGEVGEVEKRGVEEDETPLPVEDREAGGQVGEGL